MRALGDGVEFLYRISTMKETGASNRQSCKPPVLRADDRPVAGGEADEELATLAKAVGHPVRVKILRILAQKTTCICGEIADEFDLAQSTVSQHLKALKESGLITGEIDGPRTCYCIDRNALRRLKALIAGL
jgi:ArsR family transcriptional regulator